MIIVVSSDVFEFVADRFDPARTRFCLFALPRINGQTAAMSRSLLAWQSIDSEQAQSRKLYLS
jgi:hypothetical protein